MERDLEVKNLIDEFDTLNSLNYQNNSFCKTNPKRDLNKEDCEKYNILNKKAKTYGIICFILLLVRFILPLSIGIVFWKIRSLTFISTVIFLVSFIAYFLISSVFIDKISKRYSTNLQRITYYIILLSELTIFAFAYYENKTFLAGIIAFAIITLVCGYLYNLYRSKYLKNLNEKNTILLNQKFKNDDLLLKNTKQRMDEIKKQLYEKGIVYCNHNQLNSFINMNGIGDCCPICGEKLLIGHDYVVKYIARQPVETDAVLKNGVILKREFAASITYKNCEKIFPATKYHCSHCDYNFFISKVSFYSNENIYEKDFDGYGYNHLSDVKKELSLIKLEEGKLYSPVVNNWKNKIIENSFKLYDDFIKNT